MGRLEVRVVAQDSPTGGSLAGASLTLTTDGVTAITDRPFLQASGGAQQNWPVPLDTDGAITLYFDQPALDLPGPVKALLSGTAHVGNTGPAVAVNLVRDWVVHPSDRGSWTFGIFVTGNEPAPQRHWYVNKFTGHDFGEDGYWGDGYAGVTEDKAFRTVAGALAKIPANGNAELVLAGGKPTSIATMLGNVATNHVYEVATTLNVNRKLSQVAAIRGAGSDAQNDQANTLIVDGAGFPNDTDALRIGNGRGDDLCVVNRVGAAIRVTSAGQIGRRLEAYGSIVGIDLLDNGMDLASPDNYRAYKCGVGILVRTEAGGGAKLPNDIRLRAWDASINALANVMVKAGYATTGMTNGGATYPTEIPSAGYGIGFHHGRCHYHPILGKIVGEGGKNIEFVETYAEDTSSFPVDSPHVTWKGHALINGANWLATTAYNVGDVVRGTSAANGGLPRLCYFECTIAGTSGATEPQWLRFSVVSYVGGSNAVSAVGTTPWTAGDVGKNIRLAGAAAGGDDLLTTISGFTDSSHITVTVAPTGTDTQPAVWGLRGINETIADGTVTWKLILPKGPRVWAGLTTYSVGQCVVPTAFPTGANGGAHIMQCIVAGTTAAGEPGAWNTASGGTTGDGTVTWKEIGTYQAFSWRNLYFRQSDIHGLSIAGWTVGVPRVLDVDWGEHCRWETENEIRGVPGAVPTANNRLARTGQFAFDVGFDATGCLLQTSANANGFAPGVTADNQVLQEFSPGGGGNWGVWWDETNATQRTINPPNRFGVTPAIALTDGANVPVNAGQGFLFLLSAGGSRTISAPTNGKQGQIIDIEILNNTGGAIVTTWNAAFKLAGAAWTDPATTKRRAIRFRFDGTNWWELGRTAADV